MKTPIALLKRHFLLIIFLILYLVFSFATYKIWPIANGEEFRYLRGKETLEHFLHGQFTEKMVQPTPNYFLYSLYPMLLVALNPKFYYEWFHLINLIFSVLGFVAVYLLGLELFKSQKKSLLCVTALVLFPGFFGQLAIDPADVPFMVFFLLTLYFLLKFSSKNADHWSTLLLGVLLGITQGLRQLGFTLYVIMVVLDLYDFYFSNPAGKRSIITFIKSRIVKYISLFIFANFFMLITWPNFAVNFFKNFRWYLLVGSNFYLWDFGLLFGGKFLENWQRPWYYLPFFQLVTYPVYITLLFLPTVVFIKSEFKNRTYFIITFALALNYLIYLVLHPVLYDGIRHFLFMIPLIVLLAFSNLIRILSLLRNKLIKIALITGIVLNLLFIGIYTVKEFPYIYPYFNTVAFAFGNPYKLYESDYSNTKYREAAEWIRDVYLPNNPQYSTNSERTMLKVYACDNAYAVDYFSHKKFITVIDKEKAGLILCDYRNLKQSGHSGEVIKDFYLNGFDELYVLRMF